jgi:hypothetical protein
LSIKGQLKPTLDWLQARIALSDEKLGDLVPRRPTILNLSIQEQLEQPNPSARGFMKDCHWIKRVSKGQCCV